MALPTFVKSLNGMTVPSPYKESGIDVTGENTHVTGSSGATISEKCQSIANSMNILSVSNVSGDDYKIRIGSYNLTS